MKILIISWYFPPHNTIGALRVGKFAKHLAQRGHEVRVVAGDRLPFPTNLPLEFPGENVRYMRWYDVDVLPRMVQGVRLRLSRLLRGGTPVSAGAAAAPTGGEVSEAGTPKGLVARGLRAVLNAYTHVVYWPDGQIGWLPGALRGGHAALKDWRPDLIFASGPPFTGFLAAARLARRYRLPWVAEFRDRWLEDRYLDEPGWRRALARRQEDRTVAGAVAVVTATHTWAEAYRARWGKPTEVVYNGFDPADFPPSDTAPPPRTGDPGMLNIAYTGIFYPPWQDPTPLFAALAAMGEESRAIRLDFYGTNRPVIESLIARYDVADRVFLHDRVPYRDALAIQRGADVLLAMLWNDARYDRLPAKLFEYLAARRPILALGTLDAEPSQLLESQGAARLTWDTEDVVAQLRHWMAEKRAHGKLADLPESVRAGVSRTEQYDKLIALIETVVPPSPGR